MKTFSIIICSIVFFVFIPLYANTPVSIEDGDDPEEITLQQTGEEPTGTNCVSISAVKWQNTITVTVSNYSGPIFVCASGISGSESTLSHVVNMGSVQLDISSLPSGYYNLIIQINNRYIGHFHVE